MNAPPEGSLLALDNVRVDLPIAGAGSRVLAGAIDYAIVSGLAVLWIVGGIALVRAGTLGGWVGAAIFILGFFALDYGYFAGVEVATGGRTAGKLALSLRVVGSDGGRASTAGLLLRNAVRTIDVAIGVPLMLADPLARRLGDRLGGTLVLHDRAPTTDELVVTRLPRGWGSAEAVILESFLRREEDLEPERAEAMAQKLVSAIDRDDPAFLAGVEAALPAAERLRRAVES